MSPTTEKSAEFVSQSSNNKMTSMTSTPKILTTVVNCWPGDLPFEADADPSPDQRCIFGGPVYKLKEVQSIATPTSVATVTPKGRRDTLSLGWSGEEIAKAICSLKDKHYRNSSWCNFARNRWIPCDAYQIPQYYEPEFDPPRPFDLYLKLAVNPNTQLTVVVISCHPS